MIEKYPVESFGAGYDEQPRARRDWFLETHSVFSLHGEWAIMVMVSSVE